MSRRLKVAVMLQPGAAGTAADTREQARYAEQLGLDGIFVGDHLKPAGPYPESMVVLAATAAVTERVHVGFGVIVLALRDPRVGRQAARDTATRLRGRALAPEIAVAQSEGVHELAGQIDHTKAWTDRRRALLERLLG